MAGQLDSLDAKYAKKASPKLSETPFSGNGFKTALIPSAMSPA
jgi:hypothetical protein